MAAQRQAPALAQRAAEDRLLVGVHRAGGAHGTGKPAEAGAFLRHIWRADSGESGEDVLRRGVRGSLLLAGARVGYLQRHGVPGLINDGYTHEARDLAEKAITLYGQLRLELNNLFSPVVLSDFPGSLADDRYGVVSKRL